MLVFLLGASIVSCSEQLTPPDVRAVNPAARAATTGTAPQIVVSQIYGGGGNSGATYTNDFIELHNTGGSAVAVDGWSVQYASAAGTSWQVTPLAGTIPAGAFYLVQEAKGSGGTTALPTPDATGAIAMAATAGKVALFASTTAGTGTCPAGVIDQVSFGGAASDCGWKTTATLTNTTAAIRKDAGCAYTWDLSADFQVAAPAPRNSAAPLAVCPGALPVGPLDHVQLTVPATVIVGDTVQLVATPQDANNQSVSTATVSWSSSDPASTSLDPASGRLIALAASMAPVTISVTATDGGITKSATALLSVVAPQVGWIDLSSSATSFPPGFQTQIFATARVSSGGRIIPATFTFTAADPTIATVATVENTGIVTGVSAGKPGIAVTAVPTAGGTPYTFTAHPVTIEMPVAADPSIYGINDEFGDPSVASASDPNNLLITRPEYTISYNESRGTPNWVSYELDARQFGAEDRCNCFTADPLLPAAAQIFTSDYTNAGFDRGHMTRSADRTAANVDNATTYYLTNVVPQTADLNEGVWAQFENALADSAEAGRAVYIITGPLYTTASPATLKNEGKVAVPDYTWKVAFIGPRVAGVPFTRGNVQSWSDVDGLTVLAVQMPNINGVRNDPWSKYLVTVDALEAATHFDFLSLLPTAFQNALEAGDHAPVPAFSTSGTLAEGSAITFDASASTDPDLGNPNLGRTEALTYAWHFSDGTVASGPIVTHAFADNGSDTATLTVTDAFGWQEATSHTVDVANVPPTVSLGALPTSILSGEIVGAAGRFADPGPDATWQALLDYGNGQSTTSSWQRPGLPILGVTRYFAAGTYTITLAVTDKDGGVGTKSVAVTVGRRPVLGLAEPRSINAGSNGDLKITLGPGLLIDVSSLDPASVRIGLPGQAPQAVKLSVQDRGAVAVLRYDREDLATAGLLAPATTQLDVTGTLANGVQIVSHVSVNVH